jgi:hypothetical protein
MASTYPFAPVGHDDNADGHANMFSSAIAFDSSHLSPPRHVLSRSTSPSIHNAPTPQDSIGSSLSFYQGDASDVEHDENTIFGVDFNALDASTTPLFDFGQSVSLNLNTDFLKAASGGSSVNTILSQQSMHLEPESYPLTPEHSILDVSPRSEKRGIARSATAPVRPSTANLTADLYPAAPGFHHQMAHHHQQLTPSRSCRSSEDDNNIPALVVPSHSPRVTVSVWGKDGDGPMYHHQHVDQPFGYANLTPVTPVSQLAGEMMTGITLHPQKPRRAHTFSTTRSASGGWHRNPVTGLGGIDPDQRTSEEIPSINETVTRREIEERNKEVGRWLTANVSSPPLTGSDMAFTAEPELDVSIAAESSAAVAEDDGIPLGDQTENRELPDQPYFQPTAAGDMTQEDVHIISASRNWGNAPMLASITRHGTFQPESSNAAIARFERQCQDNESIVSKAATWGTRRRSLPSVDVEGIVSGNFLRKLTLNTTRDSRRPSLLKDLRGLVRKPSTSGLLKRRGTAHEDDEGESDSRQQQQQQQQQQHVGVPLLAPPSRTSSWGKKPTPSINTALVTMSTGMASIGTTHARSGSINNPVGGSTSAVGGTNISPKSPFGNLAVRHSIRRQRSKSDVPPPRPTSSKSGHSNLAEMWKKSGGPPVPTLANTAGVQVDDDDEDDDEDGLYADPAAKAAAESSSRLIHEVPATLAGFQQHVVRLNPMLAGTNTYLAERIAHQQVVRYKSLLTARVKHMQQGAACPSGGSLCAALGGVARHLNEKGELRVVDPITASIDATAAAGSDGEVSPIEGLISQESFPNDIPMPPTQTLPAEFECQLCFQPKKFQKPSDWTKHVHEDVQPFTCTWDKCREPKMFKRKADWVRHENEGHRHLEWWTCDVDECRHTCYRRDNFLQHLVREHKFAEPKIKTKAAVKRAGGSDPTWAKVEQCHTETSVRPQDEPCRFCDKTFPSWKKLTVHLAKHMEQISLPVLRLVAAKELSPDTIISPVQDLPPRQIQQQQQQQQPHQQHHHQYPMQGLYQHQHLVPSQMPHMRQVPQLSTPVPFLQTPSPYGYAMRQQQQPQPQPPQHQHHYPQHNQYTQQQYYGYDGMGQTLDIDMPTLSAHSMTSHSLSAQPLSAVSAMSHGFGQPQQQQQQQQPMQTLPVTTGPYAMGAAQTGAASAYIPLGGSAMEPFPSLDSLSMIDATAAGYGVMPERQGRPVTPATYGQPQQQQQQHDGRGVSPYSGGSRSRTPSFYGQH